MKTRLLFLNYLIWKPQESSYRQKHEQLSKYYEGSMLHLGNKQEGNAGSFKFYSVLWRDNIFMRHLLYLTSCLFHAIKNGPFAAIISYDPLLCGFGGVLVKGITRAKLVIEVNTDHLWMMENIGEGFKNRIINKIGMAYMRLCFHFADSVKFINKRLSEEYSRHFALDKKQILYTTFFDFTVIDVFRRTGPNPNGPILCVGHPYDIKGVDVLLRAFNSISAHYPHVKLKIIGHCEDRKPYEQLAEGNPNIYFQKGMHFAEIITEFEHCRFLILPSRTEAMGRVLIEAMACGKAVIGSRIGGIPEVIKENETGLLFESENHVELANRIRKFLDDPDLVERMGGAGYERAKRLYSAERYRELYHDLLEDILAGKRPDQQGATTQ